MRSTIILALACATAPTAVLAQARPAAPKTALGAVIATPAANALSLSTVSTNEPRVQLNLENAPIRDALKQLFNWAKQSYKVDDDVPDTARITVQAKNVRLSTALELLLQDAGLGVVRQLEDGKLTYRIRKSGSDTLSSLDLLRAVIDTKVKALPADPTHLQQFLRADPNTMGLGSLDPKLLEQHLRAFHGAPFVASPNAIQAIPYVMSMQEQRSVFRCPHCKGQATVIRQQDQPKCEKCSRPFQSGWQFCPADGAKRPAAVGAWKFCPFCSKKVEGEKGAGVPFLGDVPIIGRLFQTAPSAPPAAIAPPPVKAAPPVKATPATSPF